MSLTGLILNRCFTMIYGFLDTLILIALVITLDTYCLRGQETCSVSQISLNLQG